MQSVVF